MLRQVFPLGIYSKLYNTLNLLLPSKPTMQQIMALYTTISILKNLSHGTWDIIGQETEPTKNNLNILGTTVIRMKVTTIPNTILLITTRQWDQDIFKTKWTCCSQTLMTWHPSCKGVLIHSITETTKMTSQDIGYKAYKDRPNNLGDIHPQGQTKSYLHGQTMKART